MNREDVAVGQAPHEPQITRAAGDVTAASPGRPALVGCITAGARAARWLGALGALGFLGTLATLSGCGRERSEREQRNLLLPDPAPGVTPPPAEVLEWVRRDSELVMGANFVQLRTTALWRDQLAPWLTGQLAATLPALQACGVDLLASVETLTLGLRRFTTTIEGSVVLRGPEPRRLWSCLRGATSALRADGLDPVWSPDAPAPSRLDVLSLRTPSGNGVVLVAEPDGLIRGLLGVETSSLDLSRSAKKAPMLRASPGFRGLYSRLDGNASGWFLLQGSLLAPAREENAALRTVLGTVTAAPAAPAGSTATPAAAAPALHLEARLRTATSEHAVRYADTAHRRLQDQPAARAAFTRLDITADRDDVRVLADLTAEQLLALIARGPALAELFAPGAAPPHELTTAPADEAPPPSPPVNPAAAAPPIGAPPTSPLSPR